MLNLTNNIRILLIEDNRTDVELITEALKESEIPHHLTIETYGDAGLRAIKKGKPHLVLLDLNLPKKSGLEILRSVKRNRHLRLIPIIILTNSRSQDDITQAYASHCNAYLRKPLGYDNLLLAIKCIGYFWIGCATIPNFTPTDLNSIIEP
jgi:two-component system, chemotaxis family, response regulator Rcp1